MTYQDELEEQAVERRPRRCSPPLAAYEAGQLTADALVAVVAAYIAAGNSAAAALADLSLAAAVTVADRHAVAPLGITRPADDPDRLDAAPILATSLADAEHASAGRAGERLAARRGQEAAARAYSEAVKRSRERHRLDPRTLRRTPASSADGGAATAASGPPITRCPPTRAAPVAEPITT